MNIELARKKMTELGLLVSGMLESLRYDILYKQFVDAEEILKACEHLYDLARCYASINERITELRGSSRKIKAANRKSFLSLKRETEDKIASYDSNSDPILDAPGLKVLKTLSLTLKDYTYPVSNSDDLVYHPQLNGISRAKNKPVYLESKGYEKVNLSENINTTLTEEEVKDLWLQRDEIDAVETFLIALEAHLTENDVESIVTTSRFAWDEARHHYYGLMKLAEYGIDEKSLPYNVVGIAVRSNLEPLLAQAQIHLFGEVGIISRIKEVKNSNSAISEDFQWIYTDENMHVNEGVALLKAKGVYGKSVRKQISQKCKNALIKLDIFDEEYISALDDKQLNILIGE
ncbi:hypothetical protein [Erwinia mallotivora]|uniref:hypothetical protein n=1 Tax=Erwinia mallotivora TaxID=69222 RepID=UPI0021BE245F|nr:hypothetical protein [Erwinia mallotivora]